MRVGLFYESTLGFQTSKAIKRILALVFLKMTLSTIFNHSYKLLKASCLFQGKVQLLGVTCLFILSLNAQRTFPKFYELNSTHGLSQNAVYDVLQDSKGFMWAATEFGLNKYDGYQFTTYLNDPEDPKSLSNNFLNTMYEDSKGNLWIGTNGSGISKFNQITETFTNYTAPATVDSFFQNNSVWSILEMDQFLWLGTFGGGLKRFNTETEQWNSYHLPYNDVRCLSPNGNGKIWIGTFGNGLNLFDPETKKTEHIDLVNSSDQPVDVLCLLVDGSILWIGTEGNGVFKLNTDNNSIVNFKRKEDDPNSLSGNVVRSIIADPNNSDSYWLNIWGQGLCFLNDSSQTITRFMKNAKDAYSLPENTVLNLYADQSGLLWAGTYKSGLVRFKSNSEKFETVFNTDSYGIRTKSLIKGMWEDSAGLWLANSSKGLELYNGHYRESILPAKSAQEGLYFVLKENDSIMWLGTLGNGLIQYNTRSKQHQSFWNKKEIPKFKPMNSFHCGLKDSLGQLWFGTYGGGLCRYNPNAKTFTWYRNDPNDPRSLSDNSVMILYEDSKRNLWVGTGTGGLNRFDPNTEKFHRLLSKSAPGPTTSVTSIQEDSQGQLWVGSTNGLYHINSTSKPVRYFKYTSNEGLSSDRIYALLIDSYDNKWLSTTNGICRISNSDSPEKQLEVELYDQFNGINIQEFATGSFHKGKSGFCYFGGVGGFVKFNPDSIYYKDKPPNLTFTDLKIMNKSVLVDSVSVRGKPQVELRNGKYYMAANISYLNKLELSYNERVITVEYSSLDFNHPEKNQYFHKLEGFDREWVSDKTKRSVTYTNLPAGDYSLLVKGSNDHGIWSSNILSLDITITPPFWKTWWFIVGLSSFLLALIAGYIKSRFNRIRSEKILLEQKVVERTSEINAQRLEIEQKATELFEANEQLLAMSDFKETLTSMLVHDLKNPLSSIIGVNESNSENKNIVEHSAKLMLNLVMNILDVQKLQESKIELDKKIISLYQLANSSISYVGLSAKQKNISVAIEIKSDIGILCDESFIERVLINLLSNAIEYTPTNGTVNVFANLLNSELIEIGVTDNGRGIPKDQIENLLNNNRKVRRGHDRFSTGIGLQYCQLALKAHDSNLEISSQEGIGSTFKFILPSSSIENKVQIQPLIKDTIDISSESYRVLLPIAERLLNMEVYEGGKILKLLESIESRNVDIDAWVEELRNAIFASNAHRFNELIQLVLKYESEDHTSS